MLRRRLHILARSFCFFFFFSFLFVKRFCSLIGNATCCQANITRHVSSSGRWWWWWWGGSKQIASHICVTFCHFPDKSESRIRALEVYNRVSLLFIVWILSCVKKERWCGACSSRLELRLCQRPALHLTHTQMWKWSLTFSPLQIDALTAAASTSTCTDLLHSEGSPLEREKAEVHHKCCFWMSCN